MATTDIVQPEFFPVYLAGERFGYYEADTLARAFYRKAAATRIPLIAAGVATHWPTSLEELAHNFGRLRALCLTLDWQKEKAESLKPEPTMQRGEVAKLYGALRRLVLQPVTEKQQQEATPKGVARERRRQPGKKSRRAH